MDLYLEKNRCNFNDANVRSVWGKAKIIDLVHEICGFRQDSWGSLIKLEEYGNRNSIYGWEIDHIIPLSKGGSDLLYNLQPLNYKNNLKKSDAEPLSTILESLLSNGGRF